MGVKILHQVWIQGGDELPEEYQKNRQLWRDSLPKDWEMKLWDEQAARERWADYAEVSDKCFHHATRCDLILARAQRDIGGLSCGTDVIPLNVPDLMKWVELNDTLVIVNAAAKSCSNGLSYFGNTNHPFLNCLCRHQLRDGGKYLGSKNVWMSTGPGAWYQAFVAHRWNLSLVTDSRVYGKVGDINPKSFVDPGCAGSWHTGFSNAISTPLD